MRAQESLHNHIFLVFLLVQYQVETESNLPVDLDIKRIISELEGIHPE